MKQDTSRHTARHDLLTIYTAAVEAVEGRRAETKGFDPAWTLRRAAAGSLLEETGDLIRTGPTGTNVMDLMLGLKFDASG